MMLGRRIGEPERGRNGDEHKVLFSSPILRFSDSPVRSSSIDHWLLFYDKWR
jgi:hypothetical protein